MKKYLITTLLILSAVFVKAQSTRTPPPTMSDMTDKPDTSVLYLRADKNATFPGGMAEFYKYVKKEIRYPENSKKQNIQGKVFLTFVVERNGKLSQINIIRGVAPDLNAEAVRIIQTSPSWEPGKIKDIAVRQQYTVPVNFTLDN